jgi:hypothetical protein
MYQLLGLLLLLLLMFGSTWILGLVVGWYLTLPLAALVAVVITAVWFNAGKRS